MEIDGRKIASEIKEKLKKKVAKLTEKPSLAIIYVGKDKIIDQFIKIKKKFGEEIGVQVLVFNFPENVNIQDLLNEIQRLNKKYSGIIIQLPLPANLPPDFILNSVSLEKDIDVLSEKSFGAFSRGEFRVLPPVVAAVKEIFYGRGRGWLKNKKIAIIGEGRLVGKPIIAWLRLQKIEPIICNKEINLSSLKNADIIISGAGSPHLIKPGMIKKGVILIDAGTSETGGKILGDIDPLCYGKSSLFTPVPGGVGSITVAKLFENLVNLSN